MPKVSVIIPNFNHALFLQQRIDSVINQTYQKFEVIILDDCSSDDSRRIIEEYRHHPKVSHIVYNENNSGTTFKQWQKGIELAVGEYIWIAESDDFCSDIFLEEAVKAMDENLNASLFFCQSNSVDSVGKVFGDMHWWIETIDEIEWYKPFTMDGNEFTGKVLIKKNAIVNASAVLFRKKNIQNYLSKIGSYKMCGDWFFWALLLKGNQVIYSPKKMNFFRTHDQSTRDNLTTQQNIQRVLEAISVKQQIFQLVKRQQTIGVESGWDDILSVASLPEYVHLKSLIKLLQIKTPNFYSIKFLYYSLKRYLFQLLQSLKFKKAASFFY